MKEHRETVVHIGLSREAVDVGCKSLPLPQYCNSVVEVFFARKSTGKYHNCMCNIVLDELARPNGVNTSYATHCCKMRINCDVRFHFLTQVLHIGRLTQLLWSCPAITRKHCHTHALD